RSLCTSLACSSFFVCSTSPPRSTLFPYTTLFRSKAEIFSDWVYSYVGDLRENALVEISGQNYESIKGIEQVTYDFSGSDAVIFKDRKSTRLNSSHVSISYAVFCLKKKNKERSRTR